MKELHQARHLMAYLKKNSNSVFSTKVSHTEKKFDFNDPVYYMGVRKDNLT
jgi:hypothetical protein